MGNSIGGKKRTAKVMKIDGTTLRFKPPAQVGDVLRDHPGHDLLESEEVKQLGLRAQPLHPDRPLKAGKFYFLVELPRLPDQRAPRRAWSGALHVSAKDRLENLKLSRRSVSDLTISNPLPFEPATAEPNQEGAMRVRLRLPRAQVTKLLDESKDPAEAAQKIIKLCAAREKAPQLRPALAPAAPVRTAHTRLKEKRTRFMPTAAEVIG